MQGTARLDTRKRQALARLLDVALRSSNGIVTEGACRHACGCLDAGWRPSLLLQWLVKHDHVERIADGVKGSKRNPVTYRRWRLTETGVVLAQEAVEHMARHREAQWADNWNRAMVEAAREAEERRAVEALRRMPSDDRKAVLRLIGG